MSVKASIESKIKRQLKPTELSVDNESHLHNVPEQSETHFKITLVAEAFEGKRQVQRHRLVYSILSEELSGGVHALAIHTFTPREWLEKGAIIDSPICFGGSSKR